MRSLVNQAKKNLYTSASASQSATMNSINFTTTKESKALLPPHTLTHSYEHEHGFYPLLCKHANVTRAHIQKCLVAAAAALSNVMVLSVASLS